MAYKWIVKPLGKEYKRNRNKPRIIQNKAIAVAFSEEGMDRLVWKRERGDIYLYMYV